MTNAPLEIDKYGSQEKWCLTITFLCLIVGVWVLLTQQGFGSTLEAATRDVLQKRLLLEILQYSQQNTCAGVSFLIKCRAEGLQLY